MKKIRWMLLLSFMAVLAFAGAAKAAPILFDDFNSYASGSQVKNDAIWESWNNAWAWDGTGGLVDGYGNTDYTAWFPYYNALFFTGAGLRAASTVDIDLSMGGLISFNLSLGSADPRHDGPFERQDGGENVVLEFSVDSGANWYILRTFDINEAAYTNVNRWSLFEYEIEQGTGAASSKVAFKVRQLRHSGSQWDTWAFDNFQIASSSTTPAPIPEPTTMLLLGAGLMGLAGLGRKRFFNQA